MSCKAKGSLVARQILLFVTKIGRGEKKKKRKKAECFHIKFSRLYRKTMEN